jgi:NhaP-type Na+/H+ or K+/H+ antiporter
MNNVLVVVSVGLLYFLAHAFAGIYSRTKIPDVLLLMIVGLVLGPLLGIVTPKQLEQVGSIFIAITLIVILFQSGLGISLDTLRKASSRGVALTITNFFVTMIVSAVIVYLTTKISLLLAFMLGATVGGTSSAVVIPLLGQLKMKSESAAMLVLESALTDVLCIVFALAFLGIYKGDSPNISLELGSVVASFLVATVLGFFAACIWAFILNKMRTVKDSIFATLAFVFVVFGIAELSGFTGYIAALAFGITIGNMESIKFLKKIKISRFSFEGVSLNETEKLFFSEIVFILKTFFFVYIGISITITNSWWMYIGLMITVAAFIYRVPIVKLVAPKTTPPEDASLMAIMVPKGLAAAALASLALQQGITGGDIIQNVTFAVVLFSIIITSILIFLLYRTPVSGLYRRFFSRPGSFSDALSQSAIATETNSSNIANQNKTE